MSPSFGNRAALAATLLSLHAALIAKEGNGNLPPEGPPPHATILELPDVEAESGGIIAVPVRLDSSTPVFMAAFSIEFDPTVLELVEPALSPEIAALLEQRGAVEGIDWLFEWFHDNEAGWVQAALVIDFGAREGFGIPPGHLRELCSLIFRVWADAPAGTFPLAFTRGESPRYDGNFRRGGRPVFNATQTSGRPFTKEDRFEESSDPGLDDGSVIVSIIGDVGIFVRGDANGDLLLDIADPIAILAFLFLDAYDLACEDAADWNDDGVIDISDPIDILRELFVETSLPSSALGLVRDETLDGLDCAR